MLNQHKGLYFLTDFIRKLVSLVNDLRKALHDQKKKSEPKFRLVDWVIKDEKTSGMCRVQIIGTSKVIDEKPENIAENRRFILGFSPQDVYSISTLAALESNKATLKILSIDLADNVVTVEHRSKNIINVPIHTFGKNEHFISQLTAIDAFKLGRLVGDRDSIITTTTIKKK